MNRYTIIDFETTGNSPKNGDKIIQIGLAVVEDGSIVERYASFVNPEQRLPPFIQQLTGITDDDVKDAPLFEEVAPELLKRLDGAYFVAHNVRFDLNFMNAELDESGYEPFSGPIIDTVELARILLPTAEAYKLSWLADHLSITHENPHQADSDAEVTAELLLYLFDKLNDLPIVTLHQLAELAARLYSDIEVVLNEMIEQKQLVIEPEGNFEVFRDIAMKRQEELKEIEPMKEPILFEEAQKDLADRMAQIIPGFEVRKGQSDMMKQVALAFEQNQHALIEAGTGIGKSLGYLLPGVVHAKNTGKPVVVSTHTIQLQEQLLQRDIPFLRDILPFEFGATIIKGRSNYLDLTRFEQQLYRVEDDNYDTILTKAQILIWLLETDYGDVEELNLSSGGKLFWQQVKSDAAVSANHRSPWFSRDFYHRRKRFSMNADLIISNHALLFSDLINEHQLLPAYQQAVIDEAHHLEDIATEFFGVKTDYFAIIQGFVRMGLKDGDGLYGKIVSILKDLESDVQEYKVEIDAYVKTILGDLDELFRMLHRYVQKNINRSNEIGRLSYRLTEESGPAWEAIQEAAHRLVFYLKDLDKVLKKLEKEFDLKEDELTREQLNAAADFKGIHASVLEELAKVDYLLLQENNNDVKWVEIDPKGALNSAFLFSRPVEVGTVLSSEYFGKKKSILLTSATLTVRNSFDYMVKRLGLEEFGPIVERYESPFDYSEQARLMIPTDLPMIKDVSDAQFVEHITDAILQIARVTRGRMLVLFTSYDMLRKAHHRMKELIEHDELTLISQGVDSGSRVRLTKNFKESDEAILFGTSSFWEGVDIPGEDLSCLIIVRLPFSPPDNPVFQARSEQLKESGGNPFMELSLPEAIIRFKQGFGRLVRSQRDRGAVFVFDRRIISTRYGRSFVKSLPEVPLLKGSIEELVNELDLWL
ncbi:ATP-dependent DNA helicase DinG [Pseudalkalibacillus hwajinpoensis]|uniref:ATP-dependent DNA helicase DinG n=1 Tax=Guptibacillus hwajinpoensis TaxID=208199 RepID=UPI00325B63ED